MLNGLLSALFSLNERLEGICKTTRQITKYNHLKNSLDKKKEGFCLLNSKLRFVTFFVEKKFFSSSARDL